MFVMNTDLGEDPKESTRPCIILLNPSADFPTLGNNCLEINIERLT